MEQLELGNLANMGFSSNQLKGLSSEAQELLKEMNGNERNSIVQYLIVLLQKQGKAENDVEACEVLIDLIKKLSNEISDNVKIGCGDFKKKSRTINLLRQLEMEFGSLIDRNRNPDDNLMSTLHFPFGTVSHQVVGDILKNQVPDLTFINNVLLSNASKNYSLFSLEPEQIEMFDIRESLVWARRISKDKGDLEGEYLNTLRQFWAVLSAEIRDKDNRLGFLKSSINTLEEMFYALYGPYINALSPHVKKYGYQSLHYYLLTLMSWIGALDRFYQRTPRAFFKEINVFNSTALIGGGIIDGLEIFTESSWISQSQLILLETISKQRFKSVPQLIKNLFQIFGPQFRTRIWELKFAIGDADIGKGIIESEKVKKSPINKHRWQVMRYLLLANYGVCEMMGLGSKEYFDNYFFFKEGQIVYIMPTTSPLIHRIAIQRDEIEELFHKMIAGPWVDTKAFAYRELLMMELVNSVIRLTGRSKRYRQNVWQNSQTSFFSDIQNNNSVLVQAINNSRQFIDDDKIIEQVITKEGKTLYRLHYDQLLEAIKNSRLKVKHFNSSTGGFIKCLDPNHKEADPSMNINVQLGLFHCFGLGCGLKGKILSGSVPKDLTGKIKFLVGRKISADKLEDPILPKDHLRVMNMVQEILQQELRRNPDGQSYLEKERRIDLSLAYQFGAGYGSDNLIRGLLDRGITYQQLIYYGFLTFASNVSPKSDLCSVFYDFGMRQQDLVRETSYGKPGLPKLILDRRVTFPLTLPDGAITSIYGRATWTSDRKMTHRKLKNSFTGIGHGAYNMTAIRSQSEHLAVVEGSIDLLSLYQMGVKCAIALIGTENDYIFFQVAKSNKKHVWAGFDNDPPKRNSQESPGVKATKKFFEQMKEFGYKGELHNLTAEFLRVYPKCNPCKDFNQVLQEFGALPLEGLGIID